MYLFNIPFSFSRLFTKTSSVQNLKPCSSNLRMEHFCYVCHRRRSWRYHLQHPITSGKPPTPGICSRCIRKKSQEPPLHPLEKSIKSPPLPPSLSSSSTIYEVHHYHHYCKCVKDPLHKDTTICAELDSENYSSCKQYIEQLLPIKFFPTKSIISFYH